MALVEQVAPLEGARVVTFDYSAAEAALSAARAAHTALVDGGAGLVAARDGATVNWNGQHRHEFERADKLLGRSVAAALDALAAARRSVHGAVAAANEQQAAYNQAAASPGPAAAPPGRGAPSRPVV